MALTTEQAHAVAVRAVPAALGRTVTEAELWSVLAVGRKESGFGHWPSPPHAPDMTTSRNWGAVQCVAHASRIQYLGITDAGPDGQAAAYGVAAAMLAPSAVEGHCAMALDYRPGRGWFVAPYRWYATDDEAAADVARLLDRNGSLAAVRDSPDTYTLARAMFAAHYYTGTSGTSAEIGSYASALARQVREMAQRLRVAVPPLAPLTEAEPGGSGPFRSAGGWARALVVPLSIRREVVV